ncbi:hypothetical protein BU17DRAFT_71989 [Hysterangium stoloniferum]|nr:hypothetical protein BU17DRAFT_71989 [Hysterangium stoloniferum]
MTILVTDHYMTQPSSAFPLLLASSKWDDLHALVEDYVVDYQHYYSKGHCSEFRPAIVPNIVMLLRDSNATVQSNGELPLVKLSEQDHYTFASLGQILAQLQPLECMKENWLSELYRWSLLSMCFGKFRTAIAIPDIVILLKDTDDSIQHNGVLALVKLSERDLAPLPLAASLLALVQLPSSTMVI